VVVVVEEEEEDEEDIEIVRFNSTKGPGNFSCLYRVRAFNAQLGSMHTPSTQSDHQNKVVEPHTTANIMIFYSIIVISYL